MHSLKITNRYAKALLDLAVNENRLDELGNDLEFIQQNIVTVREISLLLKSPIIKIEKKRDVFTKLFKNKISDTALNFCDLVIRRQRGDLLINIIKKFFDLKDEYLNIKNITVKSAVELDNFQINELKSILEQYLGKKVILRLLVDKSLIGGFIVQVDDTVIDASLKHQLDLLRKKFLYGTEKLN